MLLWILWGFRIICPYHICFTPPLTPDTCSLPRKQTNNPPQKVQFVLSIYSWVCGLSVEPGQFIIGNTLTSQKLSIVNSSPASSETSCPPPLSMLRFGLAWTCTGLVILDITTGVCVCVCVCVCALLYLGNTFLVIHHSPSVPLQIFLSLFL